MSALPVGTLLFNPNEADRPIIWTVAAARTLIANSDDIAMKGVLTKAGLPEGWKIINNRALAQTMKSAQPKALEGIVSDE